MALIPLLLMATLPPYLVHSTNVNVGIINGTEAKSHSRPYMVSVQKDGKHHCGGFLVSDQYVMSAAHCSIGNPNLTAVLGAHDLSNSDEKVIKLPVESIIYDLYHPENLDYDIMLLKLPEPVQKSETVAWISIPKADEEIPSSTVCSVAGWGKTERNEANGSDRLVETDTTVMNRTECAKRFIIFTSRMMCAMYPGEPCKGDSGGPLVCNNVAVSIVSFGHKPCELPDMPEVFAKIGKYLDWIKKIIGEI